MGIVSHLLGSHSHHPNGPTGANDAQNQFADQTDGNTQLWAPHSVTQQQPPATEPAVKLSPLPPKPDQPAHFKPLPILPNQLQSDSTNDPPPNFPTIKPLPKLERIQTRPLPALEKFPPQNQSMSSTR